MAVANILRLASLAGQLSAGAASMAHADLLDLPVVLFPYEASADRAWQLRTIVSLYDARYVALAEQIGADLVTLDRRLAAAPGPRCTFRTPPER